MTLISIEYISKSFKTEQQYFVEKLKKKERSDCFQVDSWHKSANEKLNGNGESIIVENGQIIDKGGINYSFVFGDTLPSSATHIGQNYDKQPFQATGLSIVIHPKNPYIPTSHANIRFFQTEKDNKLHWWFGGGFDLTPFYIEEEDIIFWHKQAKKCCQPYGEEVYPTFKKQCDDYFYLPHRDETRGIGGLFFDELNEQNNWNFTQAYEFVLSVARCYSDTYCQIIEKNINKTYSKKEKDFQLYRRGRYVEFNLLYDRGTIFGLQSGGRTESILMSLPNEVHWHYNKQFTANSPEAQLTKYLKPTDWINL